MMARSGKTARLTMAAGSAIALASAAPAQTTEGGNPAPASAEGRSQARTPAGAPAATPLAPQPATPSDTPPEAGATGDIVVTGSRIVRDGFTAPTPVTVAPVDDLVRSTPTNIPDGLNKLPQFQLSSGPRQSNTSFANGANHGNLLNLRGVNPNRTLILFDGVRLAPTTFRGDVDVDVIPNLLIERVEVVTGGASAAYGSDAVAGVVNFILNRKFTGFSGVAQAGVSQRGDNGNYRVGLAGGTDLFDGRAHLLLSAEIYDNNGMRRSDRKETLSSYCSAGATPGSTAVPGNAANPFRTYTGCTNNVAAPGGLIRSGPFAGFRFLPDGSLTRFNPGTRTGTADYGADFGDGFVIPLENTAIAAIQNKQAFGRFSAEPVDDLTVYVQGNFTRSDVHYTSFANALVPPNVATLFSGNPYIPAPIQSALTAGNIPSFQVGVYLSDRGPLPAEERTDFWLATGGVEGKLFGDFKWNASYTHGDSTFDVVQHDGFNYQRTYAALDAVRDPASGNIVCRVLLDPDPTLRARYAGCQPLNIIGVGGSLATDAGYDYATTDSAFHATIRQDSVQASTQGSLFNLPAGPVSIAVGGEYRRQRLHLTSTSDPSLLDTFAERNEYFRGLRGVTANASGFTLAQASFLTNVGAADGKVNVKEAFGEIVVPVLKDTPFFRSLELNAAGRITDYSTSGTVKTWKLGATWKPIEDLLLRGTRSRDIRAPSLFDLFAGINTTTLSVSDPVTGLTQVAIAVSGGNPDLVPEVADTLTFGGVISPRFLPGFSLSVDYYRLKIDKAIGTLGAQQIVNNCSVNASAPECALINRSTPTSFPSQIRTIPANIAFLKTTGIDIDASYRTNIGSDTLSIRLYANYLDSFKTQQSATAPVFDFAGRADILVQPSARPHWRGTLNVNYSTGPLNVFVAEQYIGHSKLGSDQPNQVFVDPGIGSVWYTDLTVSTKVPAFGGNSEFFVTVNNLFDRKFPIAPGTNPGTNIPTIISVYDQVLRAFTAGVRMRF